MQKLASTLACLVCLGTSSAMAQVIVTSPRVVTYYSPAPVTTYYSPADVAPVIYEEPIVTRRAVTTYYAPATTVVPTTTYYAPAPVTTYYSAPVTTYYAPATPVTTYYAPVTTFYGSTVVASPIVVGRPVTIGRSAYGTLRPYVPGQPIRNALRFSLP